MHYIEEGSNCKLVVFSSLKTLLICTIN